ncbi:transcription elongation factor GreA [Candidatus Daviesbacteria bacterium]|nr:transcription elongation factor GreA [Candidatus Daviesbacteria bacterium]
MKKPSTKLSRDKNELTPKKGEGSSSGARRASTKVIYVTQKGLSDAHKELDELRNKERPKVAEKIQQAREYGDLSENSEYEAALSEQSLIESRISELEEVIKSSKVIVENHSLDFVVIGSSVTLEMGDEVDEFTIVGRLEADPAKKRISNESPLGAALLGARTGEVVEVATPIVRYKCKVLEIK